MVGVGEEEVAVTIAASMLGGQLVGNDVARGNDTIGDDDDNDSDGAMGYDDHKDGDG